MIRGEIMGSIDKVKLTSGKILKAMRMRFGYTQAQVSEAIDISVSNYWCCVCEFRTCT